MNQALDDRIKDTMSCKHDARPLWVFITAIKSLAMGHDIILATL